MRIFRGIFIALVFATPVKAQFADVGANLVDVEDSAVAWGDYDNDDDLDLLIIGCALLDEEGDDCAFDGFRTKLYRNDNAVFTEQATSFENVADGSVSWGDYNNDGFLDVLLIGRGTGFTSVTSLYRNLGNGSFVKVNAGLIPVRFGAGAFGDYDNDGDLDIVVTGRSEAGNPTSEIYRNDQQNTFTQIGAGLTPLDISFASWGDYDGDNDLDLLLHGTSNGVNPQTDLYRNNDGTSFTKVSSSITDFEWASADWGDFDNDGDLDLLVAGGNGQTAQSVIYRNSNGSFTDINAGLIGTLQGSVSWGDVNNDGDLDILVVGINSGNRIARIYEQISNSTFTLEEELTGVEHGAAAWGDYDGDGDLDIVVTGKSDAGFFTDVFRNDAIVSANNAPTPPTGLQSEVTSEGVINLSWLASSDVETPSSGLTYAMRVGTTPGGADIASPAAASDGLRRNAAMGIQGSGTSWKLRNLEAGTYFWGLQAVDHGFVGSAFSTEGTFTVVNTRPVALGISDHVVLEDSDDTIINLDTYFQDSSDLSYQVLSNSNAELLNANLSGSSLRLAYISNQSGVAQMQIRATDTGGLFVDDAFTVTVNEVNDPPAFTAGADIGGLFEDEGNQFFPNWVSNIEPGPSESNQLVTFETTVDRPELFVTEPQVTAEGHLFFTVAANQNGVINAIVQARDNGGTANGGMEVSPPQAFTINITGVNDAPSFNLGTLPLILEDAGLIVLADWATSISAGPEENDQNLSFEVAVNEETLFEIPPFISPEGQLSFKVAPNTSGTVELSVILKDDGGVENGGIDSSNMQREALVVLPVNDAPTFVRGANQSIPRNAGSQEIVAWATEITPGASDESGQALSFEINTDYDSLFSSGPTLEQVGSSATLRYTPVAGDSGRAVVSVVLKDDGGTEHGGSDQSEMQVFSISVGLSNNAPDIETDTTPFAPAHNEPFTVVATVRDSEENLSNVQVLWDVNGATQTAISMTALEEDRFEGMIPGLPGGSLVAYTIVAEDSAGLTDSTQLPIQYTVRPAIPEFVDWKLEENAVVINWKPATGSSHYVLYRDTVSPAQTVLNETLTDTLYTDPSIDDQQIYYYRLTAVNEGGESAFSDEIAVSRCIPRVPVLEARNGPNKVLLFWDNSDMCQLGGFRLFRNGEVLSDLALDATQFDDEDVVAGVTYTYEIVALSLVGVRSAPSISVAATPFFYAAQMQLDTGLKDFGDHTLATNYRLVGLPGNISLPLASTFEGQQVQDWNAFFDNGTASDDVDAYLVEYSSALPEIFSFRVGKGFWVIQNQPWRVQHEVETSSLSDTNTVAVSLHPGWNIITNPFAEPVEWSRVQEINRITDPLWGFEGTYEQRTMLEPYEAYYLFNGKAPVKPYLAIPFPNDVPPAKTSKKPIVRLSPDIIIRAVVSDTLVTEVRLGIEESASLTLDQFDVFAPPGAFAGIGFYLVNDDLQTSYKHLAAEYRSTDTDQHRFDLELQSSPGQSIQLESLGVDGMEGLEVYLVDKALAKFYNLKENPVLWVESDSGKMQFYVLIAPASFIAEEQAQLIPSQYRLLPAYPNPFRERTTIEYTLPLQAVGEPVRLDIYNMLGQQVVSLVDEEQAAGFHRVVWDGRNRFGRRVTNGVYIYRLRVGDFEATRTMIQVR